MVKTRGQTASERLRTPESTLFQDAAAHNGQAAAITRNAQGDIVRPIRAESPTAVRVPPPSPGQSELPQAARTEGLKRSPDTDASKSSRPSVAKKFATEVPQTRQNWHRRPTYPPAGMNRTGTNTSQLNRALWGEPSRHEYSSDNTTTTTTSSSSSSSSDDDDDFDDGQLDGTLVTKKEKKPVRWNAEDRYRRFKVGNDQYRTKGRVSKRDGRLRITVKDTSNTGYLAKSLGSAAKMLVPGVGGEGEEMGTRPSASRLSSSSTTATHLGPKPKLNIVIMVIGSRGDAQPFLKIGKVLKEEYGHRVRIATHPAFREFVERDSGLEFFSVGGDPSEFMAFMVKNPGMIPSLESVKAGDVGRRRAAMAEMFDGFWRACIKATDDERDVHNVKMMGDKDPFVADAIIANPPSFAHIHCAEALGIPLHLMFTFPYTPTQSFPHPLASIKKSNVDPGYTNFMSYPLVEMMVWQGLGDLVNDFRTRTLGLDPVSTLWAPGATYRLHVPVTYLWSPGLVPKPADWGPEIDVSGFVFLDLASSFEPPDDLAKFLDESEEPPIYIGFGSIVVDDPDKFTETIFEAVKSVGCRALVSKGWGGLGGQAANPPDNIFMLENTPHDWLFPKVRACVIHGGAGTTAIALKCGKPIMVVPFFGDQHFWGSMISASNVGPEPVPYKSLDVAKLAEGIKFLIADKAQNAAQEMATGIEQEGDGARNAVKSFHMHLTVDEMTCSILQDRVATWRVKGSNIKLSALAADVAVEKGLVTWRKLRLIRHCEWNDFEGPGEPVTGLAGSIASTVGNVFGGIGGVPYRLAKSGKQRKETIKAQKRKRKERRAEKGKDKQSKQPVSGQKNGLSKSNEKGSVYEKAEKGDATTSSNPKTGEAMDPEPDPTQEALAHVGEGVSQSAAALALAPVDLSMAVAQGFHNAPRLYGDDTVRRPPRVTGIRSGAKAAAAEFVYGIYDGWTGVVKHPVRGAKENGVQGCIKGVGMGVTGFALKNISAIVGPVGYTLKGVAKQVERGRGPVKYVRKARIAQGGREWKKPSMRLHPGASPAASEDEGHVGLSEARKEITSRVVRGWETLERLEDVVDAKEKQAGKEGGLKGRVEMGGKRKVGRKDIDVGVDEAERALERLKKGESVDEVFGPGVERGLLGERLGTDVTTRKSRQERSQSRQRVRDERERSVSQHGRKAAGGDDDPVTGGISRREEEAIQEEDEDEGEHTRS